MANEITDSNENVDLLRRMKTGDRAAFEAIYNKYWSGLYLYAYNILRERHSAEDSVQEVMVSLWMKRSELQISSPKAFLYTSVKYQVLKVIRSGKVRGDFFADLEHLPAPVDPENVFHEKSINSIVDKHISELPDKCREIFTLSRRAQLTNKEIAERLGIAQKTVENQITIALRRLRSSLGDILLFVFVYFLFF